MADINVVAENLVELLTNSVNMTDVFYDLFINPEPMDVTLYQYNTENELVPVVVPNRAKDRKIALVGTVPPANSDDTSVTDASVGVCYVNTTDDTVYFKVNDSGNIWLQVATGEDITNASALIKAYIDSNFVPNTRKINNIGLDSDVTITAESVGALPSDTQYGSSLSFANSILSLNSNSGSSMSTVNLGSITGADTDLSNLSSDGIDKLQAVKGYETGSVELSDTTLYTYIKGLYDAASDEGTDTYEIGGSTVSVPYKLVSTQSKVTLITYKSAVEQVYAYRGLAPYYILDTTSETVTLPMGELYGFIAEAYARADVKSRNIGETVFSLVPLSDAGLHPLDGSPIERNGVYVDFVNYMIALYNADPSAPYFCTEAEWEAYEQAHSVCGKFVYIPASGDNPAMIKLPKYSNKVYTKSISSTAGVVGNGMALGLWDGTNNSGLAGSAGNALTRSNYGDAVGTTAGSAVGTGALGLTLDETKSGIIADLSNITTALEGYWYIVIATSTKTAIQVDIDNVITDLNGKASKDLSNVTGTSGIRKLVETSDISVYPRYYKVYVEYDAVTGNYIGKWCEQGGYYSVQYASGLHEESIALLKNYKDTNYNIQVTPQTLTGRGQLFGVYNTNILNGSFSIYTGSANSTGSTISGVYWKTEGYID